MTTRWNFRSTLPIAVLALLSCCPPSRAQAEGQSIRVNVPFEFEVGSTHMRAGLYNLNMLTGHLLNVRSTSTSVLSLAFWAQGKRPTQTPKIVFRKYGDRYFLRELWPTVGTNHFECTESQAEKQLKISELAANNAKAPDVALALLKLP